jgi:nucleoid DNA-binding protein
LTPKNKGTEKGSPTKSQGKAEIIDKVSLKLNSLTKKEVEEAVTAVFTSVGEILEEHIGEDEYVLKVPSLGKFVVKHYAGKLRKNPFKGNELIQTNGKRKVKFNPLGRLREIETIKS